MKGTSKPFRRTAIAASATVAALVAAAIAPNSPAQAGEAATPDTAGTASATATSFRVNPTTASLSIGVTFGISLAGYTNRVSQAESRGIDLGIIGTTLAAEGCDGGDPTLPPDKQPQPLRADSRDKDASTPKSETESISGVPVGAIEKAVRADASPYSQSDTTTAGLTGTDAFLSLGSAHSQAVTHLVNGTREAVATVDIGSVGIAGVIELAGLHWEARAQSGTLDKNAGTFTIGSLKVLGQAIPANDALKAIQNANAVLAPLGIQVVYPTSHVSAGILFVDPLVIRVVPSKTRDTISQTVLGLVQPVRQSLYDALLAQDCSNATYITVSDIAIGSLTGAGSFSLELGGANASAAPLKTTSLLDFNQSLTGGSSNSLGDGPSLGNLDTSSPSLGLAPSNNAGSKSGITNKGSNQAKPIASVTKGSRGGRMALVGLLGLIVLAIVADRDRRLMRRAQRSIATEA
jgi:hypothetical protein